MIGVIGTVTVSFNVYLSGPIMFDVEMVDMTPLYVCGSKLILLETEGLQMERYIIVPFYSWTDIEVTSDDGNFVLGE